ncbi:MAG: TrkA family potassium uptake protein [Desulfurococcales archaeon]|nr:TrkA family potassium uptake protein [Desulfurococcales archaeon]
MRILIIGAGIVGSTLAERLSNAGHSVTIIDKDEDKITKVGSMVDAEALIKDATSPEVYEELDIESYDIIVAVTDRDEVNLFTAAIARLYNVENIYVRIRNPQTSRILDILGVKGVVPEPQLVANIFYSMIEGMHTVVNLIPTLTGDFHLVSVAVRPTSIARGKMLRDLVRDERFPRGVKILAVYDGENLIDPESAPVLDVGHTLIALVHRDSLREFSNLF